MASSSDDESLYDDDEECAREYPLHAAAETGDADALTKLLSLGDMDAEGDEEPKHVRVVGLDERDELDDCTPLHTALLYGQSEAARLLLSAGADAHRKMGGASTAHMAVSIGAFAHLRDRCHPLLELMIKHEVDLNAKVRSRPTRSTLTRRKSARATITVHTPAPFRRTTMASPSCTLRRVWGCSTAWRPF